jgi:hypothetical protein
MIDDLKQQSTSSPSGKEARQDVALHQLMEEMVSAKQAVQDVLKISPEDIQLHRIHGMYTGHILDIRKTMMQEAAVDRDQLLIDALKGVVTFLIQQGEGESAQFIGDHLEEIGNKVKTTWQDSKVSPNWPTATTPSGNSSPAPSRRSAKPPPNKKSNAKSARKRI